VISGYRRDVDENCTLLGSYAASSDGSLSTFLDKGQEFLFLTLEDGIHYLSGNVGKELPLFAVLEPREEQFSSEVLDHLISNLKFPSKIIMV
jgi:hypothetical protein